MYFKVECNFITCNYRQVSANRVTCFRVVLTYSIEQSPSWEANLLSASQEIPYILWNPKVYIYQVPPPVPNLSQINPVHSPIPFPEDPSKYYLLIYAWDFQVVFFLQVFP